MLILIIFIMKFKCNHTCVAGDGFEVQIRAKNAIFEGVEI